MANGSKIRGIDGVLELTKDATTEEIPCLTSWTLEASASLNEDDQVCMLSNGDGGADSDENWSDIDVGSRSFSISSEHFWQEDQDAGTTAIADVTDVGSEVTFKLYPNTTDVGGVEYSGTAVIESVSVPSSADGKVTQTLALKGKGKLTKTIIAA